ncbi:MAG: hypothetical protein RR778_16065 [Glutamicibacter sp.]|uniref:hypothetical protein n=1 Tax=Glutamicibacter sp. TaxID=1931995 RepID=UPI002FC744BC
MNATQIPPCTILFARIQERQSGTDTGSPLTARQLRRALRQLRKHRRNCRCAPGQPFLEPAREQGNLFWGAGFIPTRR